MKKKGFTLVELLAIIVVLAIIALIAVPIVLNIIEKSRQGAAISSARSYIKATETYVVSSELDKSKLKLDKNNKYNVTKDTKINDKNYLKINDLVELKGSKPTGREDYEILNEKYQVIEALLTINGYEILIKNDEVVSIETNTKVEIENMTLNKTSETMEKGSTFKLIPIFTPNYATNQKVTYASSNEDIITVNEEGLVTAKEIGNAKIIVTSLDDTSKKAECEITVVINATGLKIEPTEKEINIGETVTLVGTIEPSNATTSSLTWASSDINIASVDENGVVTGIAKGEATITATTVNGISSSSRITVSEIEVESISLDKTSASTEIGKTLKLNATISPDNASNKTITWTSDDENIATVDSSGLVTGIKEGTVKITATTSNGLKAEANITIYKAELLVSKVSVGDYVAYDAGVWTSTAAKPTDQGQFGGYTAGQNKAKSVNWCDRSDYYSNITGGWRVLKIDNDKIYLVHAGIPECYTHDAHGYNSSATVAALNSRASSVYLNSEYAESAHMLNYYEAQAITGNDDATSNNLRKIGTGYHLATAMSTIVIYNVSLNGSIYYSTLKVTDGIRPVIVLKEGIKTTGMGKDALGQNAWNLVAP